MGKLYLKWTSAGRVPSYQGGTPVPYRRWTDRIEGPVLCERGWHACRWEDAIHHVAAELWIVELDGQIVEGENKVAAERLRIVRRVSTLNDRSLRLFAADAAEAALDNFEKFMPGDDRPRKAIEAARLRAEGKPYDSAAWSAAESAAWSAAESAARSAARSAAWSAARSAAWSAAESAAWSAARSAAESAAWSAAWSAARSAARSAAWSAARSAAESEQSNWLLVHYARLDPELFEHSVGAES